MTDTHKMLMAAKAAGYNVTFDSAGTGLMIWSEDGVECFPWDPANDDGDSLRLAADALIDIEWETDAIVFGNGNFSETIDDHNVDRAAAIRRAVLRAAAFDGEEMP